jgi:hypothetical protein
MNQEGELPIILIKKKPKLDNQCPLKGVTYINNYDKNNQGNYIDKNTLYNKSIHQHSRKNTNNNKEAKKASLTSPSSGGAKGARSGHAAPPP